jgi:hypothetical protein
MATLVAPPAHFLLTYCFLNVIAQGSLETQCCYLETVTLVFFSPGSRSKIEDVTVIRKISLALVLMTMAGVASAADQGGGQCLQILWFPPICFGPTPGSPPSVKAPEIDPASAMAGLTMLAGGLAVLRGRRRIKSKE